MTRPAARSTGHWVGGWFTTSITITGEGPAYPPSVVVVIDPDGPEILGHELARPGEEADRLIELLDRVMRSSPARARPPGVRVRTEEIARRIRDEQRLPAIVGAVPEIEDVRAAMAEWQSQQPSSDPRETYLPPGIAPEEISGLFLQARALFTLAPWDLAVDETPFEVDVPALGVRGGVLTIIGSQGQTRALLLFESVAAFRGFFDAASAAIDAGADRPLSDLGGSVLSLNFERGADLHPGLRKQITKHGWPVGGRDAYPYVLRVDGAGSRVPIAPRDLRLARALAGAVNAFAVRHREELVSPTETIRFDTSEDGGPEVSLTHPHPKLFEDGLEASSRPRRIPPAVGRNERCPCGSGAKYKRCCLPKDEQARTEAAAQEGLNSEQRREVRLIDAALSFAHDRFPEAMSRADSVYGWQEGEDDNLHMQLFAPWVAYCYRVSDDRSPAELFLRHRGPQLPSADRAWLEEQTRAHLSIWEVQDVRPGEGMTLLDLLTGDRREVIERKGSQFLRVRDAVLARVAFDGETYGIGGMYPAALPPRAAAAVVEAIRRRCGWSTLPVSAEALATSVADHELVPLWRSELERLRSGPPVELRNTDGDIVVMIEDELAMPQVGRATTIAALERGGFQRDADDGGDARFTLTKRKRGGPLDTVCAATVFVRRDHIVVEANSRKRATAARKKLAAALGGEPRHIRRTETQPPTMSPGGLAADGVRVEVSSGRADLPLQASREIVRSMKRDHWRRWLDQPVPALRGLSPRAAASTAEGRAELHLLPRRRNGTNRPRIRRSDSTSVRCELSWDFETAAVDGQPIRPCP